MNNGEYSLSLLEQSKEREIQFSLDDLDTGYSPFAYLEYLPLDTLEIDCSFLSRLEARGKNQEIVAAIASLAQKLKLKVIVEGVERAQQCFHLR